MNRNILCPECEAKLHKQFPTESPYPDDHVKFVHGKAKYNCDQCFARINPDDECCAFSIWADHGRQPYYEWEGEYINLKEGELPTA